MQRARDECVTQYGPESKECQQLIEAHKACLRAEGFKVGGAVIGWRQRLSRIGCGDHAYSVGDMDDGMKDVVPSNEAIWLNE